MFDWLKSPYQQGSPLYRPRGEAASRFGAMLGEQIAEQARSRNAARSAAEFARRAAAANQDRSELSREAREDRDGSQRASRLLERMGQW